jgi:hypothetical protein
MSQPLQPEFAQARRASSARQATTTFGYFPGWYVDDVRITLYRGNADVGIAMTARRTCDGKRQPATRSPPLTRTGPATTVTVTDVLPGTSICFRRQPGSWRHKHGYLQSRYDCQRRDATVSLVVQPTGEREQYRHRDTRIDRRQRGQQQRDGHHDGG